MDTNAEHCPEPTDFCRRCGTCCRSGGPALHHADRVLVEEGKIPLKDLFTLRAGERVRDNPRDRLVTLTDEVIKIRGIGGSWACRYYDNASGDCTVYAHRPRECRLQKCWDPAPLEAAYDRDRLTRRDLLFGVSGVWDLIAVHESRCDYRRIADHAAAVRKSGGDGPAMKALQAALHYDIALRRLIREKGGPLAETLDFLFGRPLVDTIHAIGIRARPWADGYRLVAVDEAPAGGGPDLSDSVRP